MADALASGASEGNLVGVQVPPRPPRSPCYGRGSCAFQGRRGPERQIAATFTSTSGPRRPTARPSSRSVRVSEGAPPSHAGVSVAGPKTAQDQPVTSPGDVHEPVDPAGSTLTVAQRTVTRSPDDRVSASADVLGPGEDRHGGAGGARGVAVRLGGRDHVSTDLNTEGRHRAGELVDPTDEAGDEAVGGSCRAPVPRPSRARRRRRFSGVRLPRSGSEQRQKRGRGRPGVVHRQFAAAPSRRFVGTTRGPCGRSTVDTRPATRRVARRVRTEDR